MDDRHVDDPVEVLPERFLYAVGRLHSLHQHLAGDSQRIGQKKHIVENIEALVDIEQDPVASELEHFVQCRHEQVGQRTVGSFQPASADRVERQRGHLAPTVRRPVDRRVVHQHQTSVGGPADVDLNDIDPHLDRMLHSGQ